MNNIDNVELLSPVIDPCYSREAAEGTDNTNISNEKRSDNETLSQTAQLKDWAVTFKLSHIAINNVLRIFKPSVPELPLDSRTLLNTPSVISTKKNRNRRILSSWIT